MIIFRISFKRKKKNNNTQNIPKKYGKENNKKIILFQITHWHSPKFHAYFPTAQSYPAIVADMLSGAIACIGFSWVEIID